MNNKLIVILHTEYHLLSCLSILSEIHESYNEINVFICIPEGSKRFKFKFPIYINNIYFEIVNIASFTVDKTESLQYLESKIFLTDSFSTEVLFFNRLPFFAQYLIRKCYSKKIKVSLGPDGAAAYTVSKRWSPRWSFIQFLKFNRFLLNNNRFNFAFYFPTLDYANQKHINSAYAQYPELLKLKGSKELIKYQLLFSKKSIEWSNYFFDFDIHKYMNTTSNVFLFCNQPADSLDSWNKVIVDYAIKNLSKYKIVVKGHPSTSVAQRSYFLENPDVLFIESTIPIELFCANLENSLIVSFWSTTGLYQSKSNRSIWLYPYLEKNNNMNDYIKFPFKIKHIEYIDDLADLNKFSS